LRAVCSTARRTSSSAMTKKSAAMLPKMNVASPTAASPRGFPSPSSSSSWPASGAATPPKRAASPARQRCTCSNSPRWSCSHSPSYSWPPWWSCPRPLLSCFPLQSLLRRWWVTPRGRPGAYLPRGATREHKVALQHIKSLLKRTRIAWRMVQGLPGLPISAKNQIFTFAKIWSPHELPSEVGRRFFFFRFAPPHFCGRVVA
jgi:hypothetical protein